MLGFTACVLAEILLAVCRTWCSSGLGTSLCCCWANLLTNTQGSDCSCMLTSVPIQYLPLKHSGCNNFLNLS